MAFYRLATVHCYYCFHYHYHHRHCRHRHYGRRRGVYAKRFDNIVIVGGQRIFRVFSIRYARSHVPRTGSGNNEWNTGPGTRGRPRRIGRAVLRSADSRSRNDNSLGQQRLYCGRSKRVLVSLLVRTRAHVYIRV